MSYLQYVFIIWSVIGHEGLEAETWDELRTKVDLLTESVHKMEDRLFTLASTQKVAMRANQCEQQPG